MTEWIDIECEDCMGDGYFTEQCERCGGEGTADPLYERECIECMGTGTVIAGDCLRCEGAGWWSIPARPGSVGEQR